MKLIKCLFAYGVILFLVSCNISALTPSPSPSVINVAVTPLVTDPTLRPTMTAKPLIVPSTTPSVFPISTPFILYTEEPVILPTIPTDDIKSFVLELTNNNQNCLLPCFWSIIPGETEWQNAEPFLSTFAYRISYGSADGTFSDVPVGESFIAWLSLFLPEMSNAPFSYAFDVREGIVMMMDAAILPIANNTLPSILNDYGQPTEIWILTANAPMDDVLGFSLTLFYAQHNFMLTYSNWDGEIIDGKVRGCLSGEEESLRLVTWSPKEQLTFVEAEHGMHEPHSIIYDLPLEEATGISIETFYKTFRNGSEPICLETPTELWPGP